MNRWTGWFDRAVEGLCSWLNGLVPGRHPLVATGYRLAGLRKGFLLPIDRRQGSPVLQMAYDSASMTGKAVKSEAKGGTSALESDCGFWAYCHISGQPCYRCKIASASTSNSLTPSITKDLEKLCNNMVGRKSGTFWFGCCKNPSGQIRLIGFGDCCTPGYPAPQDCGGTDTSKWCENWPAAKNWCYNSDTGNKNHKTSDGVVATYYCTIVIDNGECST